MQEATVYSERLGAISDEQFHAVADLLGIGRYVRAAPTTSGLFGQNVFVTTTEGEFVLRGAPHWVKAMHETQFHQEDRWQFSKEKYFAEQLHVHTNAPVPWPMLHDQTSDILGWPYLVMPRMPGICFDERSIRKALAPETRRKVAVALAETLADAQRLTSPFPGDFGIESIELEPYQGSATRRVADETLAFADSQPGSMTDDDRAWIDAAMKRALVIPDRPNTFVHCDYKLNNLTVEERGGNWRVSGLFDLHEAQFGDGARDLVRQACSYLDTDPDLASIFVDAYLANVTADARIEDLAPLYAIHDRMKFWQFFSRPETRAEWTVGKTFRGWAERYVEGLLGVVRARLS
jgi:aminoglycoside phosphotransferase (APT) family kinase protein